MADTYPESTPPTEPDALLLVQEPPRWPKVVGIISIVWGSFWLLCGGCGIAYYAMVPWFAQMAEQQVGGPMPGVMTPSPLQYVPMALGMALDVVVIAAGIMTASRNPAGRMVHLIYGAAAIPITVLGAVLGVLQTLRIEEYFRQNPSDPWASQSNTGMGFIMIAVFTLVALFWPCFCLFWFGAAKRDAASMTGGAPPAA